ncbi:PLP-dependent transferase [Oceaniglobus roseus]|uniref:PLP-dependent transferase n=1 Tax=Oceaniglobus roseus TaxID=1737570 RepID=UPI000C7F3519|nr:PLP-dependent transferase [Kandeliimicrobium roseum]
MEESLATLLAAAFGTAGSVTPPIVQSSLFTFPDYGAFAARMAGQGSAPIYTRVTNPTVAAFEDLMARAEGGEAAVAFASGMGAISGALLAFLRPGDRVACVEHVYPDAYRLFERLLRPFGIDITYHPPAAFAEDPDLLQGVRLAYLESPNSVKFQTTDLARTAAHARRHGCLTVIDNSWATPVFQLPLARGVDIVLHSASKYISGHSDTVAGIVVGSTDHIAQIRSLTLALLGAKLAPFEAFLLTRGLRTLPARMRQHDAAAALFADRLARTPEVRALHLPVPGPETGLSGRAGLLSVELAEGVDIERFCNALDLFRIGVSWGGFESLVMPAKAVLAQSPEHNAMHRFGVSPQLVRLSLGLEEPEDLWRDFAQALRKAM